MTLDLPPEPGVKKAVNIWGHLSVNKRNSLNIHLRLMLSLFGVKWPSLTVVV